MPITPDTILSLIALLFSLSSTAFMLMRYHRVLADLTLAHRQECMEQEAEIRHDLSVVMILHDSQNPYYVETVIVTPDNFQYLAQEDRAGNGLLKLAGHPGHIWVSPLEAEQIRSRMEALGIQRQQAVEEARKYGSK